MGCSFAKWETNLSVLEEVSFAPSSSQKKDFVLVISRQGIGDVAERKEGAAFSLAEILISDFLYFMTKKTPKPKVIILLDKGTYLVTEHYTNCLKNLTLLEEFGVQILLCEKSVAYYQLEEKVKIGKKVNMSVICENIASAQKVIII